MKPTYILLASCTLLSLLNGCSSGKANRNTSIPPHRTAETNQPTVFTNWYSTKLSGSKDDPGAANTEGVFDTYRVTCDKFEPTNIVSVKIWVDTGDLRLDAGKDSGNTNKILPCLVFHQWCEDFATVFSIGTMLQGTRPAGTEYTTKLGLQDNGEVTTFSATEHPVEFEQAKTALANGTFDVVIQTSKAEKQGSYAYSFNQVFLTVELKQ